MTYQADIIDEKQKDIEFFGKKFAKQDSRPTSYATFYENENPADNLEWLPHEVDHVLIGFSGGKDSLACLLSAIEVFGADKITAQHHDIDGTEDDSHPERLFMDWPITRAYCIAVCDALGVPLQFSWREGGIEREMFKENARTADILYKHEATGQTVRIPTTDRAKISTRRKWPAISANLQTRWCSSSAKISVVGRVITSHPSYTATDPKGKKPKILMITGERREESSNRAKYKKWEHHNTHSPKTKRECIQYRAVIDWSERDVWDIIEKYSIAPHPAYVLGFGRCSCVTCIFASPDQWATVKELYPQKVQRMGEIEIEIDFTLQKNKTIPQMADSGRSFLPNDLSPEYIADIKAGKFSGPVILENWKTPAGAYKGPKGGSL